MTYNSPLEQLVAAVNQASSLEQLREQVARIMAAEIALPTKSPFELAMEKLKIDVAKLPMGFEFEIPQVVGDDIWSQLDRGSRLALGKHVKSSYATYGMEFVKTSSSNHAVYRRAHQD